MKQDVSEIEKIETKCPECGSEKLINDHERGEIVCGACGLVIDDSIMDMGPEWRAFDHEQRDKRTRVGAPITYTIHDKGGRHLASIRFGIRFPRCGSTRRRPIRLRKRRPARCKKRTAAPRSTSREYFTGAQRPTAREAHRHASHHQHEEARAGGDDPGAKKSAAVAVSAAAETMGIARHDERGDAEVATAPCIERSDRRAATKHGVGVVGLVVRLQRSLSPSGQSDERRPGHERRPTN